MRRNNPNTAMKTMRSLLALPCGVILLSGPIGAEDSNPGLPAKNVVLFGWDGAQREHVHQCLERGELPTMKGSASKAGWSIDVVTGATDTKAGWSQILTGYHPEMTGVYSNGRYRDIPEGLSVFERLEKQFGSDQFVTVAVIGKSGHCGEINAPFKKERSQREGNRGPGRGGEEGRKTDRRKRRMPRRKPNR